METVLEVDQSGTLHVPSAAAPLGEPGTRYLVKVRGEEIILRRVHEPDRFWKRATPSERAADIMRWAESPGHGPALPDAALSRDSIYEFSEINPGSPRPLSRSPRPHEQLLFENSFV